MGRNWATCDKPSQLSVSPILLSAAAVTSGRHCPAASLCALVSSWRPCPFSSFIIVSSPAWHWAVSPRGLFESHLLHTSLIIATGKHYTRLDGLTLQRSDVKDIGFPQQAYSTKGRVVFFFFLFFYYLFIPTNPSLPQGPFLPDKI